MNAWCQVLTETAIVYQASELFHSKKNKDKPCIVLCT
jgi:hypothetical protein